MWIFLALVAVPIIEIALFIQVGGWLGLWPTLAIVILTALIGTILLRRQGLAAMAKLQDELRGGGDPASAIAHGAMILIAGIVLLTPGFFTDAVGFLLLIPPVRMAVIQAAAKRVKIHTAHSMSGGFQNAQSDFGERQAGAGPTTIDGDYQDVTPPEGQAEPGSSGWTKPHGAGKDQI